MQVVILSRNRPRPTGPWRLVQWDGRTLGDWTQKLNHSDAPVNLAGRTVDCIKTADYCDEIPRSRVEATSVLAAAMRGIDSPPAVWVQMSTAHIYGDPPAAVCTEDSALGFGLAPDVRRFWESAFHGAKLPEQRGVILRTSFVIGQDSGAGGGALTKMRMLTRIGLGGTIGSGKQGMSWIHEADVNRIFERAINDSSMQGMMVASSPNPELQREFMNQLRRQLRVPFGFPATDLMVWFGAHWLLRTYPELVLYGRYVFPERLVDQGSSSSIRT